MATMKISKANAATMSELAPHLPQVISPTHEQDLPKMNLLLRPASNLGPSARTALYALWEQNIKPIAKGTDFDDDEASKREEMFEPTTRFLLLLKRATSEPDISSDPKTSNPPDMDIPMQPGGGESVTSTKKKKKKKTEKLDFGPEELLGYCSFRFDTEQTLDEDRSVEVIYCYELQFSNEGRGRGLGKVLMRELEQIRRMRGMEKSMLTCLTKNASAMRFYAKIGYTPDEIDPTRLHRHQAQSDWDLSDITFAYRILSRSL